MLKLEHLRIALDGFDLGADFTVEAGARVAVIGPSGAGKSSLLNVVAGFIPLAGGRVLLDGSDITTLPPDARSITMLFQDGNLFPHLTLAQNVGLGLRPTLRLDDQERSKVAGALARVGLDGLADRKPATVSGGQASRAALARVLVQNRPLLLLDEPFAALGPALRAEMLALVAELLDETRATLMMVTHAPEDARRIADQVVFVDAGIAHPPAPTEALFADPPPPLRAYLG